MNPKSPQDDVHFQYVKQLSDSGDWAGLTRYWMAHSHEPAIDEAIDIIRQHTTVPKRSRFWPFQGLSINDNSCWPTLQSFLEAVKANPLDGHRQSPKDALECLGVKEKTTLLLTECHSRAVWCELAAGVPIEKQNSLLSGAIEAAEIGAVVSNRLGDLALAACFFILLARAFVLKGEWEKAVVACQRTIDIRRKLALERPDVYLSDLALTLNNLGTLQRDLNKYEMAQATLEEAIAIHRKLPLPKSRSDQARLALALYNLASVEQNQNRLDAASSTLNEALTIYRELARSYPEIHQADLAMTLFGLGDLQSDMHAWELAQANSEEGLKIYRELAIQRPELYRPEVARTLGVLGNVEQFLHQFERALVHAEEAVTIYCEFAKHRPEAFALHEARTLNYLGDLQYRLNDLETAEINCDKALSIFRSLAVRRPDVHQVGIASALNNLGRIRHASNDFEKARTNYEECWAIYRKLARLRPDVYQHSVATTLNNLGFLHRDLNDLEVARSNYERALKIDRELAEVRPEIYRRDVAITLNNLGNVQRALNERELAWASYEEALKIRRELASERPEVYLSWVAMTLNNFGNLQHDMMQLKMARASFEEALGIYRELASQRPAIYRSEVAMTLNNLGNVQGDLDELGAARASYQEASQLYAIDAALHPTARIADRIKMWLNIGRLLRRESVKLGWPDYSGARDALREAVKCTELFRHRFRDKRLRKQAQEQGLHAYELLARTCVDLWDVSCVEGKPDLDALQEAVTVAERSRARNLMDRLHGTDLVPANAPVALVDTFNVLRRELDVARLRLEREEQADPGGEGLLGEGLRTAGEEQRMAGMPGAPFTGIPMPPTKSAAAKIAKLRAEVERLEREVAAQLVVLRRHDPDYNPEGAAPALSFEQIQQLIPTDVPTAFVQFMLTRDEAIALVTTRTEVFRIRLKELTDHRARELAQEWFDSYLNKSSQLSEWESALPGLLEQMAVLVARPLAQALAGRGLRRLVISPNRALHIFPLHACLLENDRSLSDEFEIIYTPSLSILGRCAQRDRQARGDTLVVGNPTGDLRFTDAEVAALRRRYPDCIPLWRSAATKEALFAAAGSSWLLHYSGHAMFNMADQLESGLLLAGGESGTAKELLTLREIFAGLNLRRNFLTILNGCESGMLRPDLVDEYVTLPSGFLYAGAVCVVSTLWAVHDLSAALLMERFHAEWQAGKSVAAALREAVRWLREDIRNGRYLMTEVLPTFLKNVDDATLRQRCQEAARAYAERHPNTPPFASPVHWAAFVATGLAYPMK